MELGKHRQCWKWDVPQSDRLEIGRRLGPTQERISNNRFVLGLCVATKVKSPEGFLRLHQCGTSLEVRARQARQIDPLCDHDVRVR